MRRIRKCFKSGNPQVVLRALSLTDTLMQSCGAHARREVGSDKFIKAVGKLCKVRGWLFLTLQFNYDTVCCVYSRRG